LSAAARPVVPSAIASRRLPNLGDFLNASIAKRTVCRPAANRAQRKSAAEVRKQKQEVERNEKARSDNLEAQNLLPDRRVAGKKRAIIV
jgi:hypothetical protein